jgi:biopolymer transport protein ExbD
VVITSRPQVTHGTFVDVLDQTKLAGAGEIAIMGN